MGEAMGCVERELCALLKLRHGASKAWRKRKPGKIRVGVGDTNVTDSVYKPQPFVVHLRLRSSRDRSMCCSYLEFGVWAWECRVLASDQLVGN